MEITQQEFGRQMEKLQQLHHKALEEARILEQVDEERRRTLSAVVGHTWKAKALQGDSNIDPLLSRKFKTKAGYSSIRLEKLLLDLDKVETFGNPDLRARRKEEVKFIQTLLASADRMNEKANRLVSFQERLATIGKSTLRDSFEATSPRAAAVPNLATKTMEIEEQPVRRFAVEPQDAPVPDDHVSEERESENDEDGKVYASPRSADMSEARTPSRKQDEARQQDVSMTQRDSADDLLAAQEEMDRTAEDYYRSVHEQQRKKQSPRKQQQNSDEIKSTKQQKMKQQSREQNEQGQDDELSQPKVAIQELPRAYIMLVQDVNARRSRVSIDDEGVLSIIVPGRAAVRYSLGSNINVNAVTKELVQGHVLRIVLPKTPSFPMRTGRGFAEEAPKWGGRRFEDFWSRF